MFAGVLMTRITKLFNMPDVTAYLIAGILIGPCFLGRLGIEGLGFINYESISNLDLISNLALGFIAFAIGHELWDVVSDELGFFFGLAISAAIEDYTYAGDSLNTSTFDVFVSIGLN